MSSDVIAYNGDFIGDFAYSAYTQVLAPGETVDFLLSATEADYLPRLDNFLSFEMLATVTVPETGESNMKAVRTSLGTQPPLLSLNPSGPVLEGESVELTMNFTNPLSVRLADVLITFRTTSGLAIDGLLDSVVRIANLLPNGTISITKLIETLVPGEYMVNVNLVASELDYQSATFRCSRRLQRQWCVRRCGHSRSDQPGLQ